MQAGCVHDVAGWDWGQGLPSATSALLQAVEVAAAAEPRPADALLPSPPSWKRQHHHERLPSPPTDACQHPAQVITGPAVAAPALLLALAAEAQPQVPAVAVDSSSGPGANTAITSSEVEHSQPPLPVLRPVVRRASQQGFPLAGPLPCQVSQGAQLASRPDVVPATHFASLQGLTIAPSLCRPAELAKLPPSSLALQSKLQATAGGQLPHQGQGPHRTLQSPFAAMIELPMRDQPTQTAAALVDPSPPNVCRHCDSQLAGPPAHALHHGAPLPASQADQLQAHHSLLGQATLAEWQVCDTAKLQRERPLLGLDDRVHDTLRLPLSPSSVRPNGEASVLQPLAKAQAKTLPAGSVLQSSSGKKMQSLFHQLGMRDYKLGLHTSQPVSQSDLLPGRNVVVATASVTDLAHLLIPPSNWCW